mmetsp:Transcript_53535/g.131103  ORF Transcript_53535/g.131103 Transcript_53535/m.131103 type:complete len:253 (+) Transcript_53535:808-1566(+)
MSIASTATSAHVVSSRLSMQKPARPVPVAAASVRRTSTSLKYVPLANTYTLVLLLRSTLNVSEPVSTPALKSCTSSVAVSSVPSVSTRSKPTACVVPARRSRMPALAARISSISSPGAATNGTLARAHSAFDEWLSTSRTGRARSNISGDANGSQNSLVPAPVTRCACATKRTWPGAAAPPSAAASTRVVLSVTAGSSVVSNVTTGQRTGKAATNAARSAKRVSEPAVTAGSTGPTGLPAVGPVPLPFGNST